MVFDNSDIQKLAQKIGVPLPSITADHAGIRMDDPANRAVFKVHTAQQYNEAQPAAHPAHPKAPYHDGGAKLTGEHQSGQPRVTLTDLGVHKEQEKKTETALPKEAAVDKNAAERDAEALRKATGNDNKIARWADRDAIIGLLENRNEAQRKAIGEAYQAKYHVSLEGEMTQFMTGATKERFLGALNRKDNDALSQSADRIHVALTEMNQFRGRSESELQKDIRDTLRPMNSQQIAAIDADYKQRYGTTLSEALSSNKHFSSETQEALTVYMKGSDKRNDQDSVRLLNAAVTSKNMDMLSEVAHDASSSARWQWLGNDGEQKLKQAFDHVYSGRDFERAKDLLHEGRISTATQIKDNTGKLVDNEKGIEFAIARMSPLERSNYMIGRKMSDSAAALSPADEARARQMSDEQKESVKQSYQKIHESLKGAGNDTEIVRWENMIAGGEKSFVSGLSSHRGHIKNDSIDDVVKQINNMSATDYRTAQEHPEQRAELKRMLDTMYGSKHVEEAMNAYDKKVRSPYTPPAATEKKAEAPSEPAEDRIHKDATGFGGSARILETLREVDPKQLDQLRSDYARKFGSSLDGDVLDKLGGGQRDEAMRLLGGNLSVISQYNRFRDQAYATRSGFGAWLSDNTWRSATGSQADEALNQQTQAMTDQFAGRRQVSRAEIVGLQNLSQTALDNHRESKAQAAEYVTDVAMGAAAVGTIVGTAGLATPVVIGIGAGAAAATRLGTKSLLMGSDYEYSTKNLAWESFAGAASGATAGFGAAQIAEKFGVNMVASSTESALARLSVGRLSVQAASGALNGGISSGIQASRGWDSANGVVGNVENIGKATFMGAAFGAAGSVAMSAAMVGGQEALRVAREKTALYSPVVKEKAHDWFERISSRNPEPEETFEESVKRNAKERVANSAGQTAAGDRTVPTAAQNAGGDRITTNGADAAAQQGITYDSKTLSMMYPADGKQYPLTPDNTSIYVHGQGHTANGLNVQGLRVDVYASTPEAVEKAQKALIPQLYENESLREGIGPWQTLNPARSEAKIGFTGFGSDQKAKAFSLWIDTPSETKSVSEQVSKILADNNLSQTAKVSIVRDGYLKAVTTKGEQAVMVDKPVFEAIKQQYGVYNFRGNSEGMLRQIERDMSIAPNTLARDVHGNLLVKTNFASAYGQQSELAYLPALRGENGLIERDALNALQYFSGVDPVDSHWFNSRW